jgi:hypothetical protein
MASPGEMRLCMAKSLGIPEATIVSHDRTLVENGLRTKGGRGRSAAKVTSLDASNLLIAIVGSSMVKDTLATVADYADLPCDGAERGSHGNAETSWNLTHFPLPGLQALPAAHTFRDALCALIESAASGDLDRALAGLHRRKAGDRSIPSIWSIEVELFGPVAQCTIAINGNQIQETHHYSRIPQDMNELLAWSAKIEQGGDLSQARTFTGRTVRAIGALLSTSSDANDGINQ